MNEQEYKWALRDLQINNQKHLIRIHIKYQQDLANAAQWLYEAMARLAQKYSDDFQEEEGKWEYVPGEYGYAQGVIGYVNHDPNII